MRPLRGRRNLLALWRRVRVAEGEASVALRTSILAWGSEARASTSVSSLESSREWVVNAPSNSPDRSISTPPPSFAFTETVPEKPRSLRNASRPSRFTQEAYISG